MALPPLTQQQANAIKLTAGGLIIFALGISLGRQLDANKSVSTASKSRADAPAAEHSGNTKSSVKTEDYVPSSFVSEEVDPLTDQVQYSFILKSTNELTNSIGSLERDTLYIRCKGSDTDAYISTAAFVSSDGQTVKLRWDDGPITSQYWGPASGGSALFSTSPIGMINQISNSKKLVISYEPYSKVAVSAVFDFKGSQDDIAKMKSVCK